MQLELSILTLNVWGIPYVSKDRTVRMEAIGKFFGENDKYDVISLQEVWTERDYQLIRTAAEKNLPYAHYFYSGVFGSGLCVLSKYPIISTLFHSWSVNGYVHRIQHGDWFGGKGVGLCKLLVNEHIVNFYIAHLHAEYDRESDDYNAHRVVQAFDTAQFVRSTRSDACVQVLAADLNTQPGDLAHRLLLMTSGLRETYNEKEHEDYYGTNECAHNSYTPPAIKETDPKGKRIDYVLYRAGFNHQVKVIEFKQPLPKTIPDTDISYSDHEAVATTLLIEDRKTEKDSTDSCSAQLLKKLHTETLNEGIDVLDKILHRLHTDKSIYFVMALLLIIPLFFLIDIYPPFGMGIFFLIAKVLFSGVIIFMIFMATMWNSIERSGILSAKLSMELALAALSRQNHVHNNSCS